MYPSNQNTAKEFEAGKSTDPAFASSSPSAPLLPPSAPYNPDMKNNLEPPPYSAVVGQDSSDWKNRSNSFSSGTTDRPYPPASSYLSGANSTSGLQNQPPYPAGPPGAMGPCFGTSVQPPYPVGPGSVPNLAGNAPYPAAPAAPGFVSQPPYPTGPSPMPNVQAPQPQIGFTAPTITVAPSRNRFQNSSNTGQGMQDGLIYPKEFGPGSQYVQQGQYQYPNQYAQQPPPQTVYVVQKNNEDNRSEDVDSCCLLACCLTSCYCLCECIKCCAAIES